MEVKYKTNGMLFPPSDRDCKPLCTTGNLCCSLTLTWLLSVLCHQLGPLRGAALQHGYSACTTQNAISPLLPKYCCKKLCFFVLCSSGSWSSVLISVFHRWTLEVTRWISLNRLKTQQGLFWVMYVAAQVTFLPNKFFSTCHFCTRNYFKTPSQLADPSHHLARKENFGIFKGELKDVNRLELQNSTVCQRAVQPLTIQQVLCALLDKLI